jgi:hypothetical protein
MVEMLISIWVYGTVIHWLEATSLVMSVPPSNSNNVQKVISKPPVTEPHQFLCGPGSKPTRYIKYLKQKNKINVKNVCFSDEFVKFKFV